jgi:glyoxylase-like metal-dependent hydrolase (beta-lactamase superfamily II)
MILQVGKKIKAVFTEDGFTASNSVLVEDDLKLMIDSGAGRILSEINTAGIDILLNSHRHLDHIKGNDLFADAGILAHPLEIEAMRDPFKIAALSGWHDLMEEDIFNEAGRLGALSDRLMRPFRIDGEIEEGRIIDCGSTTIRVLLTPGHTSGHCSFLFPEEGLVFMADICLSAVGPWYGEDDADIDEFIQSIDRIIALKPEMLITGHRSEIVDKNIDGVLAEYRDRMNKREDLILNFIRGNPSSIDRIAEQKFIYPDHPLIFVLFWEKSMVKKHLDRLIARGLAERLEDGRFVGSA